MAILKNIHQGRKTHPKRKRWCQKGKTEEHKSYLLLIYLLKDVKGTCDENHSDCSAIQFTFFSIHSRHVWTVGKRSDSGVFTLFCKAPRQLWSVDTCGLSICELPWECSYRITEIATFFYETTSLLNLFLNSCVSTWYWNYVPPSCFLSWSCIVVKVIQTTLELFLHIHLFSIKTETFDLDLFAGRILNCENLDAEPYQMMRRYAIKA